ncbi:uncharacterized protein LOC111406393 [Olea europaea var. sylvestris]|uniref:uncharacterized protein LOC111406393 n=1 Tax=Olea europaea var. sylvestris TaxID=158386 RepID=UPI000C1D0194|nr:uncharacterized protein LOC111406393 [Olea europaea var. sylvestris]
MATAKEYSLINFEKSMANLYRKSPAVGQYLEKKVGYEFWSRAHFKGIRYNIMTTNNAESLNSLFKNAREFPVLAMVEQIRKTLQKWFYERHIEAEECASTLTPPIEDKMRKNCLTKYDSYFRQIFDKYDSITICSDQNGIRFVTFFMKMVESVSKLQERKMSSHIDGIEMDSDGVYPKD